MFMKKKQNCLEPYIHAVEVFFSNKNDEQRQKVYKYLLNGIFNLFYMMMFEVGIFSDNTIAFSKSIERLVCDNILLKINPFRKCIYFVFIRLDYF